MAGAKVRFVDEEAIEVEGLGRLVSDGSDLVGPLDVAGPAALSSLCKALRRWGHEVGTRQMTVGLTLLSAEQFKDPDDAPRQPVDLEYLDMPEMEDWCGFQVLVVWVPPSNARAQPAAIRQIAAPLLARRGAELFTVKSDEQDGTQLAYIRLRFFSLRGRTVRDAYDLGIDLLQLLDAGETGLLSRETALDLLRAGRPDLLIGQLESGWLDCKRALYYLEDSKAKFEIAKDVAAFANGGEGGLILMGAEARKDSEDRERVALLRPFASGQLRPLSYRRVIHHRVYPPVVGLEILLVRLADEPSQCVAAISIPPQDDSTKPFLVRGSLIGGKVNEDYISLVTRREDHAYATDIATVHSLISAGRAALSGTFNSRPTRAKGGRDS